MDLEKLSEKLGSMENDESIMEFVKSESECLYKWIERVIDDEVLTFRVATCEFHPGVNANRCVSISCEDDDPYEFLIETGIIEYVDEYTDEDGNTYAPGELDSDDPHEYNLTLNEFVEHMFEQEAPSDYTCITE